jgi:hypothetical protein
VNETWLNIGAQNGVKLAVRSIRGMPGVGHVRLFLDVEAATRDNTAAGCPLFFDNSYVEVLGIEGPEVASHLAPLRVSGQTPTVRPLGVDERFTVVADVDHRQLQVIEQHRTGPLRLRLWFCGTTFREGQHESFRANNIDYTVSVSDWIAVLDQVGFAHYYLVELERPTARTDPKLAEANQYFDQANHRYAEGEWRLCVEALRQCLAAIVGKKADEEDSADDVAADLRSLERVKSTTKVGYEPRADLTRRVLKFYCDLGAHPEVTETRRQHARAGLLMVGGLLSSFRQA